MRVKRFRRGLGVIIATVILGAAAAAALAFAEPDGYEATARVVHGETPALQKPPVLATSERVADAALVGAGAARTSAATLLSHSKVEVEEPGTVVFSVRAERARAATRLATAYAHAYVTALPARDRPTARVREAAAADPRRRPGQQAPIGAAIGLMAGVMLALARDALDRRRPSSREVDGEADRADAVASVAEPGTPEWPGQAEVAETPLNAAGEAGVEVIIDLHCHILPGIDDGPRTLDESVELGRLLVDAGVQIVAATPHLRADHPAVVPGEIAGRCAELQGRLAAEGVALDVVPAGEVDIRWALGASEEELRLVSYDQGGTDLLLETPHGSLPPTFEDDLFQLVLAGFRPLLAHPERSPTFQQDPERLAELVRRGTLVQVATASLIRSSRRSRSALLARRLVEQGLAHVLASDAHGPQSWVHGPMDAAIEAARGLAGDRAKWMVSSAPAAVLTGESLPPPPPLRPPPHPVRRRLGLTRRQVGSGPT